MKAALPTIAPLPSPPQKQGGTLLEDNRGAIMVVAVFMATVLVGSLWYIIGLGDSMLYRERMQDGADATAFVAAVYHARGMNIIAMINILMAAVLGVLVALKLLEAINILAMAISCALSWLVLPAFVCQATMAIETPLANTISATQQVVDVVLPALSKTQMGIALAMPLVAEAKAMDVASHHYNAPVKGGGIVSVSLVPFVPKQRLGLPVEEGSFTELCGQAAKVVPEVVFSPFSRSVGKWIGKRTSSLAKTFSGYFCGSGSAPDVASSLGDTLEDEAKEACKEKESNLTSEAKQDFDFDACVEDTQIDLSKALQKNGKLPQGSAGTVGGKTPKKVFSDAENGNSYMQIWSVIKGDDQWPMQADSTIRIAGKMPKAPIAYNMSFAQAEYYYDTTDSWSNAEPKAMWNMSWRARLRRFRPKQASSAVSSIIGGSALTDAFASGVAGNTTALALFFAAQGAQGTTNASAADVAGNLATTQFNRIHWMLLNANREALIH